MRRIDREAVEQPQSRVGRGEQDLDQARPQAPGGQRLALDGQRVGQRAGGRLVVRRPKREHDVVGREGMAIREPHALPQVHLVPPPVVAPRPAVGQPRFGGVRGPVDPDQPRLREEAHQVRREGVVGEPVEGGRLAAERRDQGAGGRDRRRSGRIGRRRRPRGSADEEEQKKECKARGGGQNEPPTTGHDPDPPANPLTEARCAISSEKARRSAVTICNFCNPLDGRPIGCPHEAILTRRAGRAATARNCSIRNE